MPKVSQKEMKRRLGDEGDLPLYPDKVIAHRKSKCKISGKDITGEISLHFGFFYTHGRNSDKEAEKVNKVVNPLGWVVTRSYEIWNEWPRDSYFLVGIAPKGEENA